MHWEHLSSTRVIKSGKRRYIRALFIEKYHYVLPYILQVLLRFVICIHTNKQCSMAFENRCISFRIFRQIDDIDILHGWSKFLIWIYL